MVIGLSSSGKSIFVSPFGNIDHLAQDITADHRRRNKNASSARGLDVSFTLTIASKVIYLIPPAATGVGLMKLLAEEAATAAGSESKKAPPLLAYFENNGRREITRSYRSKLQAALRQATPAIRRLMNVTQAAWTEQTVSACHRG